MKLTSKKLKRLIEEEIKNLDYAYKKTKLDDFSASHPSDVKTKEDAWSGGENIYSQVDHLSDGGSKEKSIRGLEILKLVEGQKTMSRRELRDLVESACDLKRTSDYEHTMPSGGADLSLMHTDLIDQHDEDHGGNVPSPQDYQNVRDALDKMGELVDITIDAVMQMTGASCERSTAQAIIDHMKGRLTGSDNMQHLVKKSAGWS